MEDLERIIGATIQEVTGCEHESECVTFVTDRGTLRLLHRQNCCENVRLEDANGDIADLIGGAGFLKVMWFGIAMGVAYLFIFVT